MKLKQVILRQYQEIVNSVMNCFNISIPMEGWIRTSRKALNMSGVQLAKRLGVSRAWVSKLELSELTGAVTLKTMQEMAKAMNYRFVYAFVPEKQVEEIILQHAIKKAREIVHQANTQMALEAQTVPNDKAQFEVTRITKQLVDNMPNDFWDEA